ncbi:MAG: LAGLIDADG family homing endonuclease [Promethearchaeota archaeon]
MNDHSNEEKEDQNNLNPGYLCEAEEEFKPIDEYILIDEELDFIPRDEIEVGEEGFLINPRNEINPNNKRHHVNINEESIPVSTKIRKYHPNIKLDYFEKINTKSKAYWLGFFYADGYISNIRNNKIFGIKVGIKDEKIVDKFINEIGINPIYKKVVDGQTKARIQITCDKIASDLEKHGVIKKKSNLLELPIFDNRELYLSFLLGYFDGDGTTGTTKITSGSKKFLVQIKNYFNIKYKIRGENTKGEINGREFKGYKYVLCLGARLFNEMLDNYTNSMIKKRHRFVTNEERIEKIKENAWISSERKFKGTKKEIKDLIWKIPMTKIGKKYGVSSRTIKKWCEKWGIDTPFRGYWAKQKANLKS